MSSKSRRRGRHLSRRQRRKLGHEVSAPVTPTPTASAPTAAAKPVPSPRVAAPVPAAKATVKATVTRTLASSHNVSGELKRIGVVGGLMVAILVVAYFVLPLILD